MALTPTLAEIAALAAEEALKQCFTALSGRVTAYDATTRTATVQPLTQRAIPRDDESLLLEDLPPLPDVLVIFPMAGPFSITFPIEVGTVGLLLVLSDGDAMWRETQATKPTEPGYLSRFNLSSARFLPGYLPDAVANPAASTAALVVKGDPTLLGDETATDFVALASKVDAGFDAVITHFGTLLDSLGSPVTAPAPLTIDPVGATKVKAK